MSFGKRPAKLQYRTIRSTAFEAADEARLGILGKTFRRGLVCMAVALFGYFALQLALAPMAGRMLTRSFEEYPGRDVVEQAMRSTSPDVKQICTMPDFERKIGKPGRNVLTQTEQIIVVEARHLSAFVGYLNCWMGHDRQRFCSTTARQDLASMVKIYLGMRRDQLRHAEAILAKYGTSSRFESLLRSMVVVHSGNSSDIERRNQQIKSASNALLAVDPDTLANLRGLVEDGYISRGDFAGFLGLSTPQDLESLFAETTALRRSCR